MIYFGYLSYFHKQIKAQVCHNTLPNVHFKKNFKVNMEFPIRISYWGAIRQINYNKKVCDMFGNDSRFCFNFYGDGCYKELREYCKTQNYNNIYFGGKYKISDIGSFAQKTDILFNAYDRDFVTMLSLSVKMYDSLEYMLPMLITKDTYMADFLGEMDYVCLINVKKEYKETILKWYKKLNKEKIRRDFEKFMEIVKNDEDEFVNKLKQFCEE